MPPGRDSFPPLFLETCSPARLLGDRRWGYPWGPTQGLICHVGSRVSSAAPLGRPQYTVISQDIDILLLFGFSKPRMKHWFFLSFYVVGQRQILRMKHVAMSVIMIVTIHL